MYSIQEKFHMLSQGNDGHVSINSARDSTSTSFWHLAEGEKLTVLY